MPDVIGGTPINEVYEETMKLVIGEIKRPYGDVLGIDGATNRLAKFVSSVILDTATPLFIEYMQSDLQRETDANIVTKMIDLIKRLDIETLVRYVFVFISDSCKIMHEVRRKILENDFVKWEYGCLFHCLQNLSCDICSIPAFKNGIKRALHVSKTVKNTGMVRKVYDQISVEKLGSSLSMKLFRPTCWTACNRMKQ